MQLAFHKMHGCGNDFIVFNDPAGTYSWEQLSEIARKHCDRRFAVGADGVIAVGHGPLADQTWPDGTDYEMRYVNADGSRAEMCGNGIRCLGKYVADVLGDTRDEIKVLTGNGVLPITLHRAGGVVTSVTVGMGVPRLSAPDIPTTLGNGTVIREPFEVSGETLLFTTVNMGNPHAVSFVDSIEDRHVHVLGPQVETASVFPQKTNVEFVQTISPRELRMRVWERGCGETWACGTGACATVVAA
ncbi:MAG: diaminopimelate epimerase, partial [bacterium]|nr:diaminopimelate epimerase [bacterium]